MVPVRPSLLRGLASILLALGFAAAGAVMPAMAGRLHPEFGLGLDGLAGLGDFGKVTDPCVGGDAALSIVQEGGGFGARVAGGMHLLTGYSVPTGELIFNGAGTQQGRFEAKQSLWWVAVGPAWSGPLWHGRLDTYLMAGRAIAKASSGQGWINMVGIDPGSTHVAIARAGAGWSPAGSPVEIGAELLLGGRAAFWDNPPAVEDSAGFHVLRSRTAAVTGAVIRLGCRLGR